MSVTSQTSDSLYSKESFSIDLPPVNDLIASLKDQKASATSNDNSKLHAEIHLTIITDPSQYASSLCEYFFTLYRDVQYRPFVLQFLPSFVIAYYDLLYHHPESVDATIKDVCSTIDTFLVGIYNLGIVDDGNDDKTDEIRIPNLTLPSVYHTPNPDNYAPIPLTQHAISKHDKKYDVIRLQTFLPFDAVNATTREQIVWFLLIQYGAYVSSMNVYSRQAYFKMSKKLTSQGFSVDDDTNSKSVDLFVPPNGRRIYVSSRILIEILGTLSYFKANSTDKTVSECMRLLKHRAEYEMYADVILMTESLGYLHEFEIQQSEQQDTIGIEIELPPTVDVVKQKRAATTTRSIKYRQYSHKHHFHQQQSTEMVIAENELPNDTIEHLNFVPVPSDIQPTDITPPTLQKQKSILDVLDENTPTAQFIRTTSNQTSNSTDQQYDSMTSDDNINETTALINDNQSSITSTIGLATANISPSTARNYKPLSLASTQTYFNTIQQQKRSSSPNIQQIQTIIHDNPNLSQSRTSSINYGDRKESVASVRFVGNEQNRTNLEETYL